MASQTLKPPLRRESSSHSNRQRAPIPIKAMVPMTTAHRQTPGQKCRRLQRSRISKKVIRLQLSNSNRSPAPSVTSMFFQIALQCDCIIVDSIVRAEDQRDATLSRCCKNRFQGFRTFIQICEVFSLELFPLCRIVAEPFT